MASARTASKRRRTSRSSIFDLSTKEDAHRDESSRKIVACLRLAQPLPLVPQVQPETNRPSSLRRPDNRFHRRQGLSAERHQASSSHHLLRSVGSNASKPP